MKCLSTGLHNPHRFVGDPIDAVSGANTEIAWDFRLPGPISLDWRRHYDSSRAGIRYALGWGHSHEYDRTLVFDTDGMRYIAPLGFTVTFPPLARDGAEARGAGFRLLRLGALHFRLAEAGQPTMDFVFASQLHPAPLTAMVQDGARVSFRYGVTGALERITHSTGRVVRVDRDTFGRLVRLVLAGVDGHGDRDLVSYQYDSAGNITRGIDAYRHSFFFEYGPGNRIASRTDRRGYSFSFSYDQLGRCTHSRGMDGLYEVHLKYCPEDQRTLVTEADGGVWEYRYDEDRRLTEIVDPYRGVRSFQYNARGAVEQELDPNGDVTRWAYGPDGEFLGKRSSLGHFSSDVTGPVRPDQRAHREPSTPAEWEYGELLPLSEPGGRGSGARATSLPDSLRRLLGHLPVRTSERPQSVALATIEPDSHDGIGVVRDELGLRIRELGPNGRARTWAHDAGGNIVRYQDFDGSVVRCDYASWDLPVLRTDPIGRATAKRFTNSARIAEFVGPDGTRTGYVYDLKGRLVEVSYDGTCVERYLYDAADNMVAKLDGAGQPVMTIEIGPQNLKTVRRLASGESHFFGYTERGYYATLATDELSLTFDYDQYGHRTLDERDGLGVQHTFGDTGLVLKTTVLGRFACEYRWLSDSALEIRDPGGKRHTVHFPGDGLAARSMSNGLLEVVQYDAAGRCLAKVSSGTRASDAGWSRRFSYSGEGDLLEVEDSRVGLTRYDYDAAHRLRGESNGNGATVRYRHDVSDNLIEQPGLTGTTIASGNRIGEANGDTFDHDDRGNVAARRSRNGVTRFHYDARNMLVSCESSRGEWRASYDPLGRRVRKTFAGEHRDFYWDSDRLAAEVSESGVVRVYIYVDAFAMVPLLWLDYDSVDAELSSGRRYFQVTDHLGSPVRVEDESGEPVWLGRIAPYGRAITLSEPQLEVSLRFPGHYHDAETGLHYNRFRYYSPELGRYLQPDPLGTLAGANLYAYSTNPLKEVDLRGACPADGTPDPDPNKKATEDADKAKETADERRARLTKEMQDRRREKLRAEALAEAIKKADASGKLDDLSPADRAWLESDPRHKQLAIDLDGNGAYRIAEAKTAIQAEQEKTLAAPVRRATKAADPNEAGADFVDGDNKAWDHKDSAEGADKIAGATNKKDGENILVDSRGQNEADQKALQTDVDKQRNPDSADVVFVPKR